MANHSKSKLNKKHNKVASGRGTSSRKNKKRKKSLVSVLITSLVLCLIIVAVALGSYYLLFNTKAKTPANDKTATSNVTKTSQSSTQASSNQSTNKANWIETAGKPSQVPTLMYHYVSGQDAELVDGNWMAASSFEEQLKAIKENKYTALTAKEAKKVFTGDTKPSNKMVWLTFDDGSLTVYRDIFPLLKKYKIYATAFIVTDWVNNGQSGILTWDQIKEMKDSGLVDFQSHTASHPDLGIIDDATARLELENSKAELDKQLNQDTDIICYPAGGYSQSTLAIEKELGYKFGLADPGRNGAVAQAADSSQGLLELARYRMMGTTTATDMMSWLQTSTDYNTANTKK